MVAMVAMDRCIWFDISGYLVKVLYGTPLLAYFFPLPSLLLYSDPPSFLASLCWRPLRLSLPLSCKDFGRSENSFRIDLVVIECTFYLFMRVACPDGGESSCKMQKGFVDRGNELFNIRKHAVWSSLFNIVTLWGREFFHSLHIPFILFCVCIL